MLYGSDVLEESDDEDIDDSDTDPDFVLPSVRNYSSESADSDIDDPPELTEQPGPLMGESHINLDDEIIHQPVETCVEAQVCSLPKYLFSRLRKNEYGPQLCWTTEEPSRNVRTPSHNIVRGLPGLTAYAKTLGYNPDKTAVWELVFDKKMVDMIVINTNHKLLTVRSNFGPNTELSNYRHTDEIEINAYLGLLLLSSILKTNDEDIQSLFSKDITGRPIFSGTMSAKRFEILTSCLRFDDANSRQERRARDKAAAIQEIFSNLIQNSQRAYSVSEHVTIDEMLIPFRGRCGFKVYMPKKPKKYGVKVMCVCDAKTSYLLNAYIYTGAGSDGQGLTNEEQDYLMKPTQCVVRLCKPLENTNKNITGDNYFSSIETVEQLNKRGLTYVGTMRKDKLVIPKELLPDGKRPVSSSIHAFNGNTTLVSYVPKRNKSVILISSMHHRAEINQLNHKPEIICFYNETKCGVDLIDMKCSVYSSNRRTRRWPLAVFYRMVNIASVNSYILYLSYRNAPVINRFTFIKELAMNLIEPHLKRRLETPNLPRQIRSFIVSTLAQDQERRPDCIPDDKMGKRKTCSKCPSYKKRKTAYACIICSQAICLECSRKVCIDCAQKVV